MSVTHDDVRHVAQLARLAVTEAKLEGLVRELNGILEHMDVLAEVETGDSSDDTSYTGLPPISTPLRGDLGGPIPLMRPIESFAPATRDGFILVPRLASHVTPEAAAAESIDDDAE